MRQGKTISCTQASQQALAVVILIEIGKIQSPPRHNERRYGELAAACTWQSLQKCTPLKKCVEMRKMEIKLQVLCWSCSHTCGMRSRDCLLIEPETRKMHEKNKSKNFIKKIVSASAPLHARCAIFTMQLLFFRRHLYLNV